MMLILSINNAFGQSMTYLIVQLVYSHCFLGLGRSIWTFPVLINSHLGFN